MSSFCLFPHVRHYRRSGNGLPDYSINIPVILPIDTNLLKLKFVRFSSDECNMGNVTAAEYLFSSTSPSMAQYDGLAAGALGRGIDQYIAGNHDMAIREFRRVIALSPYSENALKSFEYLVNTLTKQGKTSEATEACRQAIKIFPSADGMNLGLGNLFYSEGRYTEATEQYKAAVVKNPTANQNVYSLGQGYLALGRYTDAETQFKRAIQLSPKDSGGYYGLGQTYRKMGKLTEAQEQLERALAIKSDFTDAHFELGMVYAEQQQADKADAELAILNEKSSELNTELATKIYEMTKPRILSAYATNLYLAGSAGTAVSSLHASLAAPDATKNYSVKFAFSKYMDALSVGTMANWTINRSTETRTGGLYNWGIITEKDVRVSSEAVRVAYDPESLTAEVTFSITQNATGDGTIDFSHLVFKFKGTDGYGNEMDTAADEYSAISEIV
jgi:tetratricopeptide (TPR) repeat protein